MRPWLGAFSLAIAAACSGGGGDPPPAIDAPPNTDGGGGDDAASVDAAAVDGAGVVDATAVDTIGPPDGFTLPDGLIGVDCVIGAEVIGPGHIASNPAGINCAPDCRETVACGSTMVLTAIPNAGAVFVGWSGACSGGTCTVTANGPLTLAFARFQ
ncbi:MAG: hypothetical protein JNK64_17710 [Myxococcales bacterium]|nr:hypothetical protein [Myxococcales bacterium]